MPSGRATGNNDALSRRDLGLEFLDVTTQVSVALLRSNRTAGIQEDVYQIVNNSSSPVDTHLLLIAKGLSAGAALQNASGTSHAGDPYRREFLPDGVLLPGHQMMATLRFAGKRGPLMQPVSYTLTLLSGQGTP